MPSSWTRRARGSSCSRTTTAGRSYVTDFYISLGKNGVEKQREGDQKTPIGVYTIVSAKEKLPDFYGPRAYPINYPNEWDKRHGRNGHGIWFHGTPSETYSRPPCATDGCVVLTNDDFDRLSRYVDVGRTPVVIGQGSNGVSPRKWEADRKDFLAAFTQWQNRLGKPRRRPLPSHYVPEFPLGGRDFATWAAKKRTANTGKTWIKVGVNEVSLFEYPGSGAT